MTIKIKRPSTREKWGWFLWSGLMIVVSVWCITTYYPEKMLLVFIWSIALLLNIISFAAWCVLI